MVLHGCPLLASFPKKRKNRIYLSGNTNFLLSVRNLIPVFLNFMQSDSEKLDIFSLDNQVDFAC